MLRSCTRWSNRKIRSNQVRQDGSKGVGGLFVCVTVRQWVRHGASVGTAALMTNNDLQGRTNISP
ncbi:hypothetical protein BC938DRAFT_476644 [Jimgerdemannia flammicorona]|uniref:Uncharacterized protein n=1 Tax=Jimgerdemannia flammicorona TaxID=994334 RepID=A0A433QQD2_9FUNG|nr:hypothetical protein BC938DRAFT_476644 [Jimgerdemannia flammicorona]